MQEKHNGVSWKSASLGPATPLGHVTFESRRPQNETFDKYEVLKLLTKLLGRYARVVDHIAVRDVAHGAPLGGGSTLHPNV